MRQSLARGYEELLSSRRRVQHCRARSPLEEALPQHKYPFTWYTAEAVAPIKSQSFTVRFRCSVLRSWYKNIVRGQQKNSKVFFFYLFFIVKVNFQWRKFWKLCSLFLYSWYIKLWLQVPSKQKKNMEVRPRWLELLNFRSPAWIFAAFLRSENS